MRTQHLIAVHPHTVTKVSQEQTPPPGRARGGYPRGRRRRPSTPPRTVQVDPRVMAEVRRIRGEGVYTRVRIVSESEVILF